MAMNINGNYAHSGNYYAEMVKEKQAAERAEKAREEKGKQEKICAGNTDKVDQEIRKLKEKKQELEWQIKSAFGDEKKTRELEKKLAQTDQELNRKDNDTYRRQHTVFQDTNCSFFSEI